MSPCEVERMSNTVLNAMTSACRTLSILTILLIIGLTVAMPAAHAQGKWVKLPPFPEPAEELLGAVAGGKFYVFAGLAPGFKPMGIVYEYDPAANHGKSQVVNGR